MSSGWISPPETGSFVTAIDIWPVDLGLRDPFVTARGTVTVAGNLFVRISLDGGAVGYGEIAPFTDMSGETREVSRKAAESLKPRLLGKPASAFRRLSRELAEAAPGEPAARCGLETALLDALCRGSTLPMDALFGGRGEHPLESDITIPILDPERTLELGRAWARKGFRVLKLKVGMDRESDLTKIESLSRNLPGISFVLDANQGFDETETRNLVADLVRLRIPVHLLEQPVPREDVEAMARLREDIPFPLCADEAVRTKADLERVIRSGAADVINLKIMKSGVFEAYDIAVTALSAGLGIMFGGMVETRLAMGCSLAMAAALGPVQTLDLDTPLLLERDPLAGGFLYSGPRLILPEGPGLDVVPAPEFDYPGS